MIWTISGKYECCYQLPNVMETIGFEIFINGVYEEDTIHFIKSKIPRDNLFLDIGANIGAICIPLNKLRKDIKIICIEAARGFMTIFK